jgi:hypothetical protein
MARKSKPAEQPATEEQPAVRTRSIKATAAAINKQRDRIDATTEDPDEEAWHAPARERYAEYQAELEAWQRAMDEAPNRAARRKLGPGPRLQLPPQPDFNARKSPAIAGPVFGRFVVTDTTGDQDGIAHDVYRATEACGIDAANPRTFVHYAGELAMAYPDAELHEACFSADTSRATAATRDE